MRALAADEGGLAPPFEDSAAMLDTAVESIARAGFEPGMDAALAVDAASSHFYHRLAIGSENPIASTAAAFPRME